MSDPAMDAAETVCERHNWDGVMFCAADAGAREMAKSVQELHKPVTRTDYTDERWTECTSCCGEWPCETAKRVYPTEELER